MLLSLRIEEMEKRILIFICITRLLPHSLHGDGVFAWGQKAMDFTAYSMHRVDGSDYS